MNKLNQHVLAAYYSDARMNILHCLNDIREKTGKKRIANDKHIKTAFNDISPASVEPEEQRYRIKQLRNRFRVLDVLTDPKPNKGKGGKAKDVVLPSPERYESLLKWMFALINDLRNTMVHPSDKEVMLDNRLHKNLFFTLNKTYEDSRRVVQDRFKLNKATINPLLLYGQDGNPKQFISFSLALCTNPWSLKDKKSLEQSQVIHDFGHVLFCSLFLDKSQSADLIIHFWQAGYDSQWSAQQKTIIKEFLSVHRVRLPIQRLQSDNKDTSVTLDTLSHLSRCPRVLFDSLRPFDQERFRGVSSLTPSQDDSDKVEDDSTYLFDRGYQNRFVPLMMHFFDFDTECKLRFAIDLGQFYYNVRLKPANKFTDGRSRVRRLGQKLVGYGRLKDFDTTIIPDDTSKKPEVWQQLEINSEPTNEEEKEYRSVSDTIKQLKPYIVPCYPHYHYYDDKIGFRIVENEDNVAEYPELNVQTAESKSDPKKIPGRKMAPEFWVSPPQMLHLAFYTYLQKNTDAQNKSLDILLKRYRGGMKRLLKALAEGSPDFAGKPFSDERRQHVQQWIDTIISNNDGKQFSASLTNLPKVVVNHLIGSGNRQVSVKEIIKRTEYLIEETEQKEKQLDNLQKRFKKRGQKGFKPIKCGHIGDFLTDDLLRFQPVDSSKPDGGKLNSQHYQILQAALAYYGAHIDEPPRIVDLLKNAGLLTGDFAHPFLSELNLEEKPDNYTGLLSFYDAYLKEREKFLKDELEKIKQQSENIETPKWLRLRQHSTLDNWLKEQVEKRGKLRPLPVPKNMLYQPIFAMVAEAVSKSSEELYREGAQHFTRNAKTVEVRPAVSWLIKRYLAEQNDSIQEMYQYPRCHDLFDIHMDNRNMNTNQKFQQRKTHYLPQQKRQIQLCQIHERIKKPIENKEEEERKEEEKKNAKLLKLLKPYKRQEKRIRHIAIQDILLFLYAKQYLSKLQLSDFAPAPTWNLNQLENTLLKTPLKYELRVPDLDTDKSLFHPECKIRNLGELRLLVRDRRLPTLLKYYPENENRINQAEIRAELDSYRRTRIEAMKLVHELENEIIQSCGSIAERDNELKEETKKHFGKGRHGDFLYTLYMRLKEDMLSESTQKSHQDAFDASCFNKARLMRNALSHNEYPEAKEFFSSVVKSVHSDEIPENPANHRKIAKRLFWEMESLYKPWLNFLKQSKRRH